MGTFFFIHIIYHDYLANLLQT